MPCEAKLGLRLQFVLKPEIFIHSSIALKFTNPCRPLQEDRDRQTERRPAPFYSPFYHINLPPCIEPDQVIICKNAALVS